MRLMYVFRMMNPAEHIRLSVFGCGTQARFAELLDTTQATVSRWESNGIIPRTRMDLIRSLAIQSGLEWDDRWFFESPDHQTIQGSDR
jgi:hypothetical protein